MWKLGNKAFLLLFSALICFNNIINYFKDTGSHEQLCLFSLRDWNQQAIFKVRETILVTVMTISNAPF